MKLTNKQSSIVLVGYIFITLGLRFWLETKIMIGIIPSIVLGLICIVPVAYLWKKDIINPYR